MYIKTVNKGIINGVLLFPTASSGFGVSGEYVGLSCSGGTVTTVNINLVANNIISGIRSYTNVGTATGQLTPGLSCKCLFDGQNISLEVFNSGATVNADIAFSIVI